MYLVSKVNLSICCRIRGYFVFKFCSKMFQNLRKCCLRPNRIVFHVKNLTTSEVSAALRPFYFSVHPDLFGQYPDQRIINENSLKQLSAILENLQAKRSIKPISLQFYVKDKLKEGTFRFIKIYLRESDVRQTVITILKSCELSTEYVDKIPRQNPPPPKPQTVNIKTDDIDWSKVSEDDPLFGHFAMKKKIKEARDAMRLRNWLGGNYKKGLLLAKENQPLKEEVAKLQEMISKQWSLLEVRWNCGWNETHFRGCLQSFNALAEQHADQMHALRGRLLVFAPFTGISLDGHVMLNSGEVRNNWLDLIKNIPKYDKVLRRIPNFEKSVSQVLRNIKVGRRKFMPKILAGEYEKNLQQITTSLSDYRGYSNFPKEWPKSFEDFEIVVENEAGPLMVSPTGQFIIPCSLPGQLLVNFITNHLDEAREKSRKYKEDKYIERFLHTKSIEELGLKSLNKDDNVTPELMIKCCERLLDNKNEIQIYLRDQHLNIATYYSVLSDGVVCIPWNWVL